MRCIHYSGGRLHSFSRAAIFALATPLALALGGCSATATSTAPPRIHLQGPEAVLRAGYSSPDPSIRAITLESLKHLHSPLAQQLVKRGLSDSSPMVEFTAAMVAGYQKMAALKKQLIHLADGTTISVRPAAIYALARLGDNAFMNALPGMLSSKNPIVRANTAFVLGRLGDKSAIALLRTDTSDHSHAVKLAVTSALARLGYRRAVNSIVALSLSPYAGDHLAALSTCRTLQNPIAVNVLLAGLKDPSPPAQLIAARGLGQRGSTLGEKIAVKAAESPNSHMRALGALALGAIPVSSNAHRLEKMLTDPNARVRIAAASGLIHLHLLAQIALQGKP
ncbi:MAG: HEAT repeat domain-containing protein [Phycisphaerae bacterium]